MNTITEQTAERTRIDRLIAGLLYKNALSSNLVTIAGAILVAFFLGEMLSVSSIPWMLAMIAAATIRLGLYQAYSERHAALRQRGNEKALDHRHWIRLYSIGCLLTGLGWASLAAYLPYTDSVYVISAIYLVLMVAPTLALPVLSVSLQGFYAFSLPICLACIAFYFIEGSRLSLYISLSAVMYLLFILTTSRHLNRHIIDGFVLQIRNAQLIDDLNHEVSQRCTIQQQLEQNQRMLEETIEQRTRELRQTNESLRKEIAQRKKIEDNLKHQAHHDALTGLPNRLLLDARLGHAIEAAGRNREKLAVLFIDLDHFKHINDSLGHDVGDALLVAISERLLQCVREVDTVARLGGDEFIILIEQIHQRGDLEPVLMKIMAAISQTTTLRDHDLYTSASIGISLYPDDGDNTEDLLRNADAAMYRAKETGRHRYCFYTRELTTTAYDTVTLETDLRKAIDAGQFEVYYQPQISLGSEKVTGVEALLRWRHPELGLLTPDVFIPLAEQRGMMIELGEFVLRQACRQMRQWREQGLPTRSMAVNLSGSQIHDPALLEKVTRIIGETGCKTEWLEMEITEDFILRESKKALSTLEALRNLGISLAIDDFGTGYSSLSQLKQLPVNKLKIDRSFVRDINNDMENAALVQAIIAMGKSLGLQLIAEGVENSSHEIFLEAQGCDCVQGFYYSRPIPASEMATFLQTFRKQRHNLKLYSSGA